MKNTPLLFALITASFASFPSACESRNNNRKNQQYISHRKGFCTIADILREESLPASGQVFRKILERQIF
ncbi:MAG: hypothetical protein ABS69_02060 [Nitrosomonadales bacterium SCN 54-20]|nr:MAG: hypothetical protein ABS69_02060 [Nitrosomonadales bacterium SCN 54-20]